MDFHRLFWYRINQWHRRIEQRESRRYHAGAHAVEVQINGRVVASAPFALRVPDR